MSTQALALVEDVKARREATMVTNGPSPFPDFDRMLQSLTEESGFSFSLDPKLAGEDQDNTLELPDFDATASKPFSGNFFDAFPSVRQPPPPGLGYPPHLDTNAPTRSPAPSVSSSYTGSFNPFAGDGSDDSSRQFSPLDDERKVSRFGFARGRQGSASASNTASPMHVPPSLSHGETMSQSYFGGHDHPPPAAQGSPAQWNFPARQHTHEYLHQSASAMSSPLAQQAQAHASFVPPPPQHQPPPQQPNRYPQQQQQYEVSEAQLRDFISASRDRTLRSTSTGKSIYTPGTVMSNLTVNADSQQFKFSQAQPFNDPAIMSARLAAPAMSPPVHESFHGSMANIQDGFPPPQHLAYGPPPGLAFPQGAMPNAALAGRHGLGMGTGLPPGMDIPQASGSAHGELLFLHYQGRESQVRVPSAVLSVRKLYHRP